MYTMYDLLRFHAFNRPSMPFLCLGDKVLTYRQVLELVESSSQRFQMEGVGRQDRVAIHVSSPEAYVVAVLGVWALGGVVVPIDASASIEERKRLLLVGQASWLLKEPDAFSDSVAIERVASVDPAQSTVGYGRLPAQLLFTSGSSGEPKAVVLSHESLLAAAIECADSINLKPSDIQMTTVPFTHAYGQNRGLNATLFAGASVAPIFDDDLAVRLAAFKSIKPTVLFSVAGFYGFLSFAQRDLGGNLRVAVSGAAPVPLPVLERFEKSYRIPLLTTYGLTEFTLISCQRLNEQRSIGTVGYPCRGVEIKILDESGDEVDSGSEGRILVRGCHVMEGYLGQKADNITIDGWLDTGDLGALDHRGLRISGRASSFIKKSGFKVFPIEIQNCLSEHPEVVDVAVAKTDALLGSEDLVVEVVLKPGSTANELDLIEYCKDRLPPYKVPALCRRVESIPRLASGKPDLVEISKRARHC